MRVWQKWRDTRANYYNMTIENLRTIVTQSSELANTQNLFSFWPLFFVLHSHSNTEYWCFDAQMSHESNPAHNIWVIYFSIHIFYFFRFFFLSSSSSLSCSPLVLDTYISFYCFSIRFDVHVLSLYNVFTHTHTWKCKKWPRGFTSLHVWFMHACPPRRCWRLACS